MAEAHQSSLFGIEPRPLPPPDGAEQASDPGSPAAPEEAAPEQIDLFADRVCLERDLESALRGGDLAEADRLRQVIVDVYGESVGTRALSFLHAGAGPLAEAAPERTLATWRTLDSTLGGQARLRQLIQLGVFRALLRHRSASELAERDPESLPALSWALASAEGSTESSRREARALVRDGLLADRRLDSLAFDWDEDLADLLAENEPPPWLACLGALRLLWPAPRLTPTDARALTVPFEPPASPEDAALAFWTCLRAAKDPDCPETELHEARRRMKKLRPDFHALFMRRARS